MVSLSQHLPNTYQTLTLIVQQFFWRGINMHLITTIHNSQVKINLLWDLFRIFASDGYTEFLHIASERCL